MDHGKGLSSCLSGSIHRLYLYIFTRHLPTGKLSAQNWGDRVEWDEKIQRDVLRIKVKSHYQRPLCLKAAQWTTITETADKHITKRKQRVQKLQRDCLVDPDPVMAFSD